MFKEDYTESLWPGGILGTVETGIFILKFWNKVSAILYVCDRLHIHLHQTPGILWLQIGLGLFIMNLEVLSLENETSSRENILTSGALSREWPRITPL